MAKEPLTITIDPDSELGRALDQTAGEPIVLLRNGMRFRVTRDPDDPWANYDPEKVPIWAARLCRHDQPRRG